MNENGQTKTPCICIAKDVSLLLYYIYTDKSAKVLKILSFLNYVPHHIQSCHFQITNPTTYIYIYVFNTEAEQIKSLNDTPPNNRKELNAIQIKLV